MVSVSAPWPSTILPFSSSRTVDSRLGVGALGDGADREQLQVGLVREHLAEGLEGGVHRTVAHRRGGAHHAVDLQLQVALRRRLRAGAHFQRDEADAVVAAHHLVVHQRADVVVVHDLLPVGQILEAAERVVELVVADLAVAQRAQLVAERGAAGVLAHDQGGLVPARRSPAS